MATEPKVLHRCKPRKDGPLESVFSELTRRHPPNLRFCTFKFEARSDAWCAPAKQLQSVAAVKTEAQRVLQAMSPAQKLRAAERLYHSARQLKAAALRAQHPDWTEEAIRQAVRQIFLYVRN
jgi:hypothetical protein